MLSPARLSAAFGRFARHRKHASRRQIARRRLFLAEPLENRALFSTVLLASAEPNSTLPAPVVTAPGGTTSPGPVLSTYTPTFQWNAVSASGMSGYMLNLYDGTKGKFSSFSISPTASSFTLSADNALGAGDVFVWNLRIVANGQSGPPSNYEYFQTAAAPALTAPVAISPGNGASPGPVLSTLTPTLTWTGVDAAGKTGYQINLYDGTAGKFTSYTAGATATSFTVPAGAMAAGHMFVWNVRVLAGSVSGPPSNYEFFQTPQAAVLPTVITIEPGSTTSPGPVLTTTTPVLYWNAITNVAGMTGYQVNLYDGTLGKFTSYHIDGVGSNIAGFQLPAGAVVPGDQYEWNVRITVGSVTGPESAARFFQGPVAQTLPIITPISPGSTTEPVPVLTTMTPTFTWSAVTPAAGMTGILVSLFDATHSTSNKSFTLDASATSLALPAGTLVAGDQYAWNVRAVAGTVMGPVNLYLRFQAPPAPVVPAPLIISPGNGTSPGPVITTLTPTFTWNAVTGVAGMTGYQINLYDGTAAKFTSYHVGADATSFTLPAGAIVAGDQYVWNLRITMGTATGPESNYLYFQGPPAQTLPSVTPVSPGTPTGTIPVLTTMTPTLAWNAVTPTGGMTGLLINVFDSTHSANNKSFTVDSNTTSLTLPGGTLVAGDTYAWTIRAVAGSTQGPLNTYLRFQAPPVPPTPTYPAPVILGPGSGTSPGSLVSTLTPTFTWNAVAGVAGMTGYQLNLYDGTAAKFTTYHIDAGASSFTLPAGVLVTGHVYVWNLRITVGSVTGPESAYDYFHVELAAAHV